MARITSRELFDERTFAFEDVVAARHTTTNYGNAGNYRYGLTDYEHTQSSLLDGGDARLLSYHNDILRDGSDDIISGSVHAILDQYRFGTRWISDFSLTNINGNAAAYDSALHTASGSDDRSFLFAQLSGNDSFALSRFDDYANGRAGNDTIRSAYGEDTIFGDSGNDSLDGGSDNDQIFGGNDNDRLFGGRSNDILAGGDGIDFLRGGDGDDTLTGSTGADTFYFARGDDADTITSFVQGTDRLQVAGMTATTAYTVTQVGADALVNFGSTMDIQILIQNTTVAQMTNADFIL